MSEITPDWIVGLWMDMYSKAKELARRTIPPTPAILLLHEMIDEMEWRFGTRMENH